MKNNLKIRNAARIAGVTQWEIARMLGISEATFTRWLRVPIEHDRETQIMEIIDRLAQEKQEVI